MNWGLRAWVIVCPTLLTSCGGDSSEPVTFVALLTPFYEATSVDALKTELASRNVNVLRYQCGYQDFGKLPFEQQGLWVDGRTPRYLLVTVSGEEAEVMRSISFPGLAISAEEFKTAHSDPFDCDPTIAAATAPFGGFS